MDCIKIKGLWEALFGLSCANFFFFGGEGERWIILKPDAKELLTKVNFLPFGVTPGPANKDWTNMKTLWGVLFGLSWATSPRVKRFLTRISSLQVTWEASSVRTSSERYCSHACMTFSLMGAMAWSTVVFAEEHFSCRDHIRRKAGGKFALCRRNHDSH